MTGEHESESQAAMKVLLCGGLAGVVTWASIFPLDVIKTRVQTQVFSLSPMEQQSLLDRRQQGSLGQRHRLGAFEVAKQAYRSDGMGAFFRGLGICSLRAFVVNAVQVGIIPFNLQALASDVLSGQCMNGSCVLLSRRERFDLTNVQKLPGALSK